MKSKNQKMTKSFRVIRTLVGDKVSGQVAKGNGKGGQRPGLEGRLNSGGSAPSDDDTELGTKD